MGGLFPLRIAHAEFGLRLQGTFSDNGIGRQIRYFGIQGLLLGVAGYGAYCIVDPRDNRCGLMRDMLDVDMTLKRGM